MNKRIKELFEQAHIQPPATRSGQFAFTPPKTFSPEKFAELIVQECVAICQDIDGEDNIDARSGRQDCAVEIKEHFGVEE